MASVNGTYHADSSPAHCSKVGRQDAAARQDGAARHAAYVLAAFDAGLEPLCAALDPCRDPVPPCRRPPKRRHAEGPGAVRGPGLQSRSGSQAAALEAVAARVAATTGLSVVLSRGSGGSGGSGKTPASSAPCALGRNHAILMYIHSSAWTVTHVITFNMFIMSLLTLMQHCSALHNHTPYCEEVMDHWCRCAAAEATELHMAVPSVLTAAVALAGAGQLAAQRVVVFGADEAPPSGAKDAWATSEDAVFRCMPRCGAGPASVVHQAELCRCLRHSATAMLLCRSPSPKAVTRWCNSLKPHAEDRRCTKDAFIYF